MLILIRIKNLISFNPTRPNTFVVFQYFRDDNSSFSSSMQSLLPKDKLFKNIFDFTTAGDWDCVAAVERLPVLHYSVDFIFLFFGIICFIWKL